MELSVVVPCYNEEESLNELHTQLTKECEKADVKSYEIILVNDGSSDKTPQMMRDLVKNDPNLVIVDLARNFGHQRALTAGLEKAQGAYIFILDADLQDPPELLHPMLERARDGVDVVYGQRKIREGESALRMAMTKTFYRVLSYMSETNIPENVGDFRLITRRVLDALMDMPERHRFIRGMIAWIGYEQEAYIYERKARFAGETKYPFTKLVKFAADAITSFSVRPLRFCIPFALFGAFMAVILGLYAIISYFIGTPTRAGWASLATIITFFSSIQLICIGLIGEYIGRTYMEIKRRPLYVVREVIKGKAKPEAKPKSKSKTKATAKNG